VTLDPRSPAPELQLIFAPAYLVRHGLDNPAGHGFTCHPGAVMPKSVGTVTLRSGDPADPDLQMPLMHARDAAYRLGFDFGV
jgi:choline dehydrogenase